MRLRSNGPHGKRRKPVSLEHQKLKLGLEIFGYDVDEYRKLIDERQQVGFTLQYLYQTKKIMSRESYDYLRSKNKEYHNWMSRNMTHSKPI